MLELNSKNISYIELMKYDENTMTTIKDNVKVKKIVSSLNRISGESYEKEVEDSENLDFINIYDKSFKKLEIAKDGTYLKVNGIGYKINNKSSDRFEEVFKKYN